MRSPSSSSSCSAGSCVTSTPRIGPQPRLQLTLPLPLAPRWKCHTSLRLTGPSRGWTPSRRGRPTVHAQVRGFCLSYLCRCTHDLLLRPRALRYGLRFAEALKATGAEDVCDRDQAQDQGGGGARHNCGYEIEMQTLRERSTSKPKTETHSCRAKLPSFDDSKLHSQVSDLAVIIKDTEALAKFKSALAGLDERPKLNFTHEHTPSALYVGLCRHGPNLTLCTYSTLRSRWRAGPPVQHPRPAGI